MAQQFHTAFSSEVSGAGIVAGGPFFCAEGKVLNALNKCMKTSLGSPSKKESLLAAKTLEKSGDIDPVKNLRTSKVYILSGTKDETVHRRVVDVTFETYKEWGLPSSNIIYETKLNVGHAFPTEDFGNACDVAIKTPFLSNCGRDVAGEILNHLIGKLNPKKNAKNSRIFSFHQLTGMEKLFPDTLSMHEDGYAYIPEQCERGSNSDCRIHVAFHGCQQSVEEVGMSFVTRAGYNNWAESNDLIILYPQISKNLISNPNGCWDWWGYSGPKYHTKSGPQMRLVRRLIEALREGKLQYRSADL